MINECRKQDIKTMICTGRNPGSIQQDVLDLPMDGAIYSGGCYIKFQNRVIQKTVIPKEDVKKIFDKIVFGIVVETELNVYMNESAAKIYQNLFLEKTKGFDEIERKRIKTENKFLYKNNIKDFDFEKEDVYKICLIDHKEKLQQFQKEVKQVCSVVQLIPFADKWMMECIPFGCDKGKAIQRLQERLSIKQEENTITVERPTNNKQHRSLHGLTRTLIDNMVIGVTNGFEKKLELVGVGYRAQKQGKKLVMNLGFSHPVEMEDPEGLTVEVPNQTELIVKGIDKQLVGNYAAKIRDWRKPEPYKGKGIRYAGEVVRRKEGKTGKK